MGDKGRRAVESSHDLSIRLFGLPEFKSGSELLPPFATHKTLSLLAFLILHRERAHARDALADLFWGDRDTSRARRSLATALWRIRRVLPPEYTLVDPTSVQFDPASRFHLDVADFQMHLNAARAATRPCDATEFWRQAIALYRGDFMEGFYDDWCIAERYRLEGLYVDALCKLIAESQVQGDLAAVVEFGDKCLARDPFQENIQLAVLQARTTLGDIMGARRQWRQCCELWQQQLHASPSARMVQQAAAILGPYQAEQSPDGGSLVSIPRRGSLEHPPWVGRTEELNALIARWQGVERAAGGMVLIAGEAGIGKTRLAGEFAAVVRWRGGIVVRGRCWESEPDLAYQPLAEILRDLPGLDRARLPAWALSELAHLVPELIEKDNVAVPARRRSDPFPEQTLLFHAIAAALDLVAARAPLLVVFEDLHWAPASTLIALSYLARQTADRPILMLGTYRPLEADARPLLRTMTAELTRAGIAQPIALAPLSGPVSAELVRRMYDREPSPELLEALYAHTAGNPLFLIETLRVILGSPAPVRNLPVPGSVRALIRARSSHLRPSARELVACAAVAGRAFDLDLVAGAVGQSEGDALEAIDELLRAGFLIEGTGAAAPDYEFSHPLFRQVIYADLSRRRRRHLHRLVGETLERSEEGRPAPGWGRLAYHFDQAQVGDKALGYAERAMDQAWGLCAASEVLDFADIAQRWLERIGQDRFGESACRDKRFELLLAREQAFDILGRRSEQSAALDTLFELAETLDDDRRRARVHVRRFWFHYPGSLADAHCNADGALDLARRCGDRSLQAQALNALALVSVRQGVPAQGVAYAQAARKMARELRDPLLEGWSLVQLGFACKEMQDWEGAREALAQSLVVNRACGNLFAVSRTLIHLGDVYRQSGREEQALACYRQARQLGQETGYRWAEQDAVQRLANVP